MGFRGFRKCTGVRNASAVQYLQYFLHKKTIAPPFGLRYDKEGDIFAYKQKRLEDLL